MPAAGEIRAAVTQALESMRRIVRGLAPTGLEARGLSRVLAELAARCSKDSKIRFDFSGPEMLPPLPSDAAEHTYRFAQEATSNIVRHARASRSKCASRSRARTSCWSISDDGSGFDVETASEQGGMGLRIMRYRAQSVSGRLAIESNPPAPALRCACLSIRGSLNRNSTADRRVSSLGTHRRYEDLRHTYYKDGVRMRLEARGLAVLAAVVMVSSCELPPDFKHRRVVVRRRRNRRPPLCRHAAHAARV
jgi:hypothetical protein